MSTSVSSRMGPTLEGADNGTSQQWIVRCHRTRQHKVTVQGTGMMDVADAHGGTAGDIPRRLCERGNAGSQTPHRLQGGASGDQQKGHGAQQKILTR